MPTVKRCKLPAKPSSLIELALKDLALVEKDPKYRVNMYGWHSGSIGHSGVCDVCLAGAVMAKTLKVRRITDRNPDGFKDQRTSSRLKALNMFRIGFVDFAFHRLSKKNKGVKDRQIVQYDTNKILFKNQMNELIKDLKAVGL